MRVGIPVYTFTLALLEQNMWRKQWSGKKIGLHVEVLVYTFKMRQIWIKRAPQVRFRAFFSLGVVLCVQYQNENDNQKPCTIPHWQKSLGHWSIHVRVNGKNGLICVIQRVKLVLFPKNYWADTFLRVISIIENIILAVCAGRFMLWYYLDNYLGHMHRKSLYWPVLSLGKTVHLCAGQL